MLLTNARVVPQRVRARLVSLFGFTQTLPSSRVVRISLLTTSLSVPSLPLAVTVWPAMSTLTPLGTGTGFLPIRDISHPNYANSRRLEYAAENFTADIGGARLVVRHDATRRRQDGDAETVVNTRQVGDLGIDPSTRLGDARDLADDRLAIDVFELDLELGDARADILAGKAADIALALQHLEHAGARPRGRRGNDRLVCPLRVADTGQHIP